MGNIADFFGIDFKADILLFGELDDLEDLGGVYVIYTQKICLDLGVSSKLRSDIESHKNTKQWLKEAGKDEIFIAYHLDPDPVSRLDKERSLRPKLKPVL